MLYSISTSSIIWIVCVRARTLIHNHTQSRYDVIYSEISKRWIWKKTKSPDCNCNWFRWTWKFFFFHSTICLWWLSFPVYDVPVHIILTNVHHHHYHCLQREKNLVFSVLCVVALFDQACVVQVHIVYACIFTLVIWIFAFLIFVWWNLLLFL